MSKTQKYIIVLLTIVIGASLLVTAYALSDNLHIVKAATKQSGALEDIDVKGLGQDDIKEMQRVPEIILQSFAINGWEIGPFARIGSPSNTRTTISSGDTVFQQKIIHIQDSCAVVHEFGHYLDYALGLPHIHKVLYDQESGDASVVLGEYSTKNRLEYFAEVFNYWVNNQGDVEKMAALKNAAPKTYEYFEHLAQNDWGLTKSRIVLV